MPRFVRLSRVALAAWALGTGWSSSSAQQLQFADSLYSTGPGPERVTWTDLDHDGLPDLLVTHADGGTFSVWLGNGAAALTPAVAYPGGARPYHAVGADLNGDGFNDVAVTDEVGDSVGLWWGDGTGALTAGTIWDTGRSPRTVLAEDLEGDGDLDLIVAAEVSSAITLLFNDGSGGFDVRTDVPVGVGPTHISAGDVDRDGDPDLAVAYDGFVPYQTVTLSNAGDGSFSLDPPVGTSGTPTWVEYVDLTGDGWLDLLIMAEELESDPELVPNDGSGQLVANFGFYFGPSEFVLSAQLNSDGVLDTIGNTFGGNLAANFWTESGSISFPATQWPAPSGLSYLTVVDLDQNGYDDVVSLYAGTARMITHLNVGCATGEPFCSDRDALLALAGGKQVLNLDAGSGFAGLPYFVLGSGSGTAPGVDLGVWNLPLNAPDAYLDLTLVQFNGPILQDTLGTLDQAGRAQATIDLPPGIPGLSGTSVDHAFLVIDPLAPEGVVFTSNPVSLELL
jgi:hypothetical protein